MRGTNSIFAYTEKPYPSGIEVNRNLRSFFIHFSQQQKPHERTKTDDSHNDTSSRFTRTVRLFVCGTEFTAGSMGCCTSAPDRLGHSKNPNMDHTKIIQEKEINAKINLCYRAHFNSIAICTIKKNNYICSRQKQGVGKT